MSFLRSKRFRRPPREPAEFLGLVAAAGVLLLAIFLALAVWSLSPAERIGTLRQDVSPATVVKRIDPTLEDTGSTLRDRVSEVVRPAVELPGKIASPMDLVPDWPVDRPVAILLLGTDKRPGDPFAKTDTMLVVRIDPVSNSAVVIGVPRDICVDLCDTEPYRINSVLFYEGPNALRDRVGDLLGVTIDHHVIMNFAGFIKLIDFVGGVSVDVPRDIVDYSYPNPTDDGFEPFLLSAGRQTLDGDMALRYVRTRWEDPQGDFGRIQRQQGFLMAVKEQILTPKLILQAPALIGQVKNAFETSLPLSEMPALAKLVFGVAADAIVAVNIDYTNSRVYPDEAENGAKILRTNKPRIHSFVRDTIAQAGAAGTDRPDFSVDTKVRQQLEP